MKIWLDDIRYPPDDTWEIARTADDAIALMQFVRNSFNSRFVEMSLDHDLGHCDNCEGCKGYGSSCGCRCHLSGTFVVNWMVSENFWPEQPPCIHSMNPVGAKNMKATIERYGPYSAPIEWKPAKYDETPNASPAAAQSEREGDK